MAKKAAVTKKESAGILEVPAPKFDVAVFKIKGTAPYVQHKFPEKTKKEMIAAQEAGSTQKAKKKREPKDFDEMCKAATHVSTEGWFGIPAAAFRNAMIDACRTVGIVMTQAKMAAFILADGYDATDQDPLVKITSKGKPERLDSTVRLASGVADIHPRPMWKPGWTATVRVRFDADMLTAGDVANLLSRAGMQVGIGEGRPFSKKSNGMGWGTFEVEKQE